MALLNEDPPDHSFVAPSSMSGALDRVQRPRKLRFELAPSEREIPEDLRNSYDRACGAVIGGVLWEGSPDTVTGVTKDEALQIAADFLSAFGVWLKEVQKE